MRINVAFCPHFHQPHFQLYRTREEAYRNSYWPWLTMLREAVNIPGFYMNLHFSGPFLYWMEDTRPEYLKILRDQVIESGRIGIVGGLADEAFPQLSSRPDDVGYQLAEYAALTGRLLGVEAKKWQGIHVVEREAGELLLKSLTEAAKSLGAPAVFYLDAETFYESHFTYPGSDYDYCRRFFNFDDAYSLTTIGHLPEDMLYFAFRDEIEGNAFVSLPVHAKFRYYFLKRKGFNVEDRSIVSPKQYVYFIKEAGKKAAQMVKRTGKFLNPLVVIFEDAEKFGQWSGDPEGDRSWMMELFFVLTADEEIKLTGLADYVASEGIWGSYPVRSSHSYPEWENWTARRGIRGVVMGDERLSRIVSRLRDVEKKQEDLEELFFESAAHVFLAPECGSRVKEKMWRILKSSPERYHILQDLLASHQSEEYMKVYQMLMRVRNLAYQEDPKWASRHPSYGSSPYYDLQALSYLELAERLLDIMLGDVGGKPVRFPVIEVRDWDFDGNDEIVVRHKSQMLVIDSRGGNIAYQQAASKDLGWGLDQIMKLLAGWELGVPAYNSIYRYVYPLVCLEADSEMKVSFYPEGGRIERTRGFGRLEFYVQKGESFAKIGSLDDSSYSLLDATRQEDDANFELGTKGRLNLPDGEQIEVEIKKIYQVREDSLYYRVEAKTDQQLNISLYMAPQLAISASPSDEVDFRPEAFVGIKGSSGEMVYRFHDITIIGDDGTIEKTAFERFLPVPQRMDYVYSIRNGNGDRYRNSVYFNFGCGAVERLCIRPAVSSYYDGYVFENQSELGIHTSGLMIEPWVKFERGTAVFEVTMGWGFDIKTEEEYEAFIPVVG